MKGSADLLLAVPITPIHPGAGRAPGVVDLPVQRDPIGYPMIYGSSLKGALRALCRKKPSCSEDKAFGSEPGGEEPGKVLVPDLSLLATPVPSHEHGYIYATTPYLVGRALSIIESLKAFSSGEAGGGCGEKLAESLGDLLKVIYENARGLSGRKALIVGGSGGRISIGLTWFDASQISQPVELKDIAEKLSELSPLLGKLGEAGLLVVGDDVGRHIVEKSLMRLTRVRLDREKKTIQTGGLWMEEYVSPGTLFAGAIVYLADEAREMIRKAVGGCTGYLLVGGKETVGKGLLRIALR